MSYEIVKTCRVVKKDDGFYYAVLKTASNNVYPRDYSEWTYGEDGKLTKEEVEKALLLDFFHGNLQGGNSKYRTAARYCPKDYLQEYNKAYEVIDKAYSLKYKLRNRLVALEEVEGQEERRKLIEKRMDELETLCCKVHMKKDTYAREGLYNYFKTTNKSNIKGIILKTRNKEYTEYVSKLYLYSFKFTNKETILTGKATIARVLSKIEKWKEHFEVTIVYK